VTILKEISKASPVTQRVLTTAELRKMDAYWRACNYSCAGMIYLRENPLLTTYRSKCTPSDVTTITDCRAIGERMCSWRLSCFHDLLYSSSQLFLARKY